MAAGVAAAFGGEQPMETGIKRLYESISDWYVDAFFDDLTDADWLRRFRDSLPQDCRILDAGAGPGNFAKFLGALGVRVVCGDLAVSMTAAARRLVPEAPAIVMDMQDLCFRDSSMDGILVAYSMLHVPRAKALDTLRGFARMLRPGGVVALMVKEGRGCYEIRSGLAPEARGLVQLWEAGELMELLVQSGIRIIECDRRHASSPYELQHPKCFLLGQRGDSWSGRCSPDPRAH